MTPSRRKVRDVMIRADEIVTAPPEASVAETLEAIDALGGADLVLVRGAAHLVGLARRADLARAAASGLTLGEVVGALPLGITDADAPARVREVKIPGVAPVWYVVTEGDEVLGILPPRTFRGSTRGFGTGLPGPVTGVARVCYCCQSAPRHCFSAAEARRKGLRPGTPCPHGDGTVIVVHNPCPGP